MGRKAQPHEIGVDARKPGGIVIERGERNVCKFQDMRCLAARRGAGIEHAHAVLRIKQQRRSLGRGILYRHQPFVKTRQTLHWNGLVEHDGVAFQRGGGNAFGGEAGKIHFARNAPLINAQGERRVAVARQQQLIKARRVLCPDFVDPPRWKRVARFVARDGRCGQRLHFGLAPQEIAKHAVDQPLGGHSG